VTKPIGPTIPRWQLGEQLTHLRDSAGRSQAEVAEALGCSVSKVQKIEAGDVGVVRAELLLLLNLYGVADDESLSDELLQLQKLGKQRGWWSTFGQVPAPFATFLGLESAARSIHIYEPLMVTGLLQTEEYARAIAETCDPGLTPEQVEKQVKLRIERQQRVLDSDPPAAWVILDEAAVRREVGGPAVMGAQLRKLQLLAKTITIQVVPFTQGSYPGVRGGLTIFEFEERMHSPVAYVETQAGNLYMERSEELHWCNVTFRHMTAAALSKTESLKLIASAAKKFMEAEGASVEARPNRRQMVQK
jgi:transcriptional regulator with XRE-family HTH domain